LNTLPIYVLITTTRGEARCIESTIKSVLAQSTRPFRWVIVSDGATDGTDEIVSRYAREHTWIELIRMPERSDREFVGEAFAFRAGAARVFDLPYEAIANLDAGITIRGDYFEFLLRNLDTFPELGIVGTPLVATSGETYVSIFATTDDVPGACQVFRRECYEAIGGYAPVTRGPIDSIAVISARMKGWTTRCFAEKVCICHRHPGKQSAWQSSVIAGEMDYAVGNHPLWEFLRCCELMSKTPYLLRGLGMAHGYMSSALRRGHRPVSREFIRFYRHEQMNRLREKFGFDRPGDRRKTRRLTGAFSSHFGAGKSD
jgi:hypothetical protein